MASQDDEGLADDQGEPAERLTDEGSRAGQVGMPWA